MQLRSFSSFTNTTPYGVFANTPINPMHGFDLVDFFGNVGAAGFLQIFDIVAAPIAGLVPKFSLVIQAGGTFPQGLPNLFETLGPVKFTNGIWFAMSSTEATYTAVGTNFDIFGDVAEWEYPTVGTDPAGLTMVGDLVTAIQTQQVWAQAVGGTNALIEIEFNNSAAVDLYALIYATDAMGANDIITSVIKIPKNSYKISDFGLDGFRPQQLTKSTNAMIRGCSISINNVATAPGPYAPASMTIRSYYKSVLNA